MSWDMVSTISWNGTLPPELVPCARPRCRRASAGPEPRPEPFEDTAQTIVGKPQVQRWATAGYDRDLRRS